MTQTPNHGYNVPSEGTTDWHRPLNDNFRQYDTDIEVRDADGNRSDYEPKQGAKFLATDTGRVYVGDGSSWNHLPSTGLVPTLSGVNTDGTNLGVGTASPATNLHVTGDPAKNGAMDLSRPAAVIENTSGDPKGDVLGLKSRVTNPDSSTDFLSFIGGSNQLGQLNGNGATGIRLGATGDLTLATRGSDVDLTTDGGGGLRLDANGNAMEIDCSPAGRIDFSHEPNTFILGTEDRISFFLKEASAYVVFDDETFLINGVDLQVNNGSKNFVQSVDTDDGEKEVVYTSTETPTPRTEVSGVVALKNGRAEVNLPEHFGWVTDGDEPLVVETTPYSAESGGLAVVKRSPDRLVVEDVEGSGDYEFSYTVRGTRDGYADETVVREPTSDPAADAPEAPAND